MKKLSAVCLALMLLACSVCAVGEGTLRVGMECNYAPFNWTQAEETEFPFPSRAAADMRTATMYKLPKRSPRLWTRSL